MTLSASIASSRARLGLVLAAAALATTALPAAARAADGSFQPTCKGSASLGEDRQAGEVVYRWACNADIAGYSIIALTRQVDAFDTEPVVLNPAGDAVPNQDFGCSGELPGIGIGCGGLATAWNQVHGSINLTSDPCSGPRPKFALTVADAKGRTAGPYRLVSARSGPANRPLAGCPAQATKKKKGRKARHHR
jgi:hypothetical protein